MRTAKINNFNVNSYVAYMIQQSTGDTTQEILGYFYGIAMFVGEDIAKTSKARWLSKEIVLFYKDSCIPYQIKIDGGYPTDNIKLNVTVGFPKKSIQQDVTNLMNSIVETGLGLSDDSNMPKFERPALKTPRCLRTVRLAQEKGNANK